jgi:hypothetical protein
MFTTLIPYKHREKPLLALLMYLENQALSVLIMPLKTMETPNTNQQTMQVLEE